MSKPSLSCEPQLDRLKELTRRDAEEQSKKLKRIEDRKVITQQIEARERAKLIQLEAREQVKHTTTDGWGPRKLGDNEFSMHPSWMGLERVHKTCIDRTVHPFKKYQESLPIIPFVSFRRCH